MGGVSFKNTPKTLYRMLYLLKPNNVDFSDMYKSGILVFSSPDNKYWCGFGFYKYEIGIYFYCPKKELHSENTGIICGIPDVDNQWNCTNKTGQLFFEVLKMALDHEYDVYPGNGFKV